ncbi:MAG TPA: two-component regulator propeller domain-containing protein [bacterium]|nr:two-component regulator propeller domain-containing protein [bacterium]
MRVRCHIATMALSAAALLVGSAIALADPNPRYKPGDWRAFTSLRFVTSAAEAPDYVYFGTRGGVARFDRYARRWATPLTTAEGLPSNDIQRLAYNPDTDELFAQTPAGYSVFRRVWDEWRYSPSFPDSLVRPWAEPRIEGWYLPRGYDVLTEGYFTDPHLRSYRIAGAIEDSYGNVWIGTWGDFVWRQPYAGFDLEPQEWGLFHDNVAAIFLDSGKVFFGGPTYYTTEGALSIYDTVNSTWQYIEARYVDGFATDAIYQFAGTPDGKTLWMATDLGVVRYDRASGRFRTYGRSRGLTDDRVNTICLDGDFLWVGTESGVDAIYLPNDSAFSATSSEVGNARVRAIAAARDVVWLGTDRGLFRLVKPAAEWTRYDRADGAFARSVRSLVVHDGHLYVGMERGIGVIDLNLRDPARVYESVDGLPDDNVFSLAVTDSILWAATRSGLVRFVPATRERRVFTVDDGMLSNLVQVIQVDGDYLWLGTEKGANRFRWRNPERID